MTENDYNRVENSSGGLVYLADPDGISVLLIRDGYGNWGFPKGHVEVGETDAQTARREIEEETGISDLELKRDLGTIKWEFRRPEGVVQKICRLFLFESSAGDPCPQLEEGITRADWVKLEHAVGRISYQNTRDMLAAITPELLSLQGVDAPRAG